MNVLIELLSLLLCGCALASQILVVVDDQSHPDQVGKVFEEPS
jgi:hypothetical protein